MLTQMIYWHCDDLMMFWPNVDLIKFWHYDEVD